MEKGKEGGGWGVLKEKRGTDSLRSKRARGAGALQSHISLRVSPSKERLSGEGDERKWG